MNEYLQSKISIKLKRLINIARGAALKDWPLDVLWEARFEDLKHAVGRDELPAAKYGLREARFWSVRLGDLWNFASRGGDDWEWLREFCQRWAKARGEILSEQPAQEAQKAPGKPVTVKPAQGRGKKPKVATKERILRVRRAALEVLKRYPGADTQAIVAEISGKAAAAGYKDKTIEQIINGVYPTMQKHGITGGVAEEVALAKRRAR